MEQFERIRREHQEEGVSIRALARRHRVHRRAVRQALASAVPPARKPVESRAQPAIGPHAATIRQWQCACVPIAASQSVAGDPAGVSHHADARLGQIGRRQTLT